MNVVRNVYTFHLRSSRLQELMAGLQSCYETIARDFHTFAQVLKKLASDDEP